MRVAYLLDFYGDLLTEKQRESLDYYYNDDLSLGEIAAVHGISRQGVRDNIKRAEAILFEMEDKLSNDINESIKVILKELDKLNKLNE